MLCNSRRLAECAVLVYLILLPKAAQSRIPADYSFQTIDFPGAQSTILNGINNRGVIVGGFHMPARNTMRGRFPPSRFPGATETVASDINDTGPIVGRYKTTTCGAAFLYANGNYLTIDVPSSMPCSSLADGTNNSGAVVGYYNDLSGGGHGFIATPNPPATAR